MSFLEFFGSTHAPFPRNSLHPCIAYWKGKQMQPGMGEELGESLWQVRDWVGQIQQFR